MSLVRLFIVSSYVLEERAESESNACRGPDPHRYTKQQLAAFAVHFKDAWTTEWQYNKEIEGNNLQHMKAPRDNKIKTFTTEH